MDHKEWIKTTKDQTVEHMLKKIWKLCEEADESGHMSCDDARAIKDCWKAIWYAHEVSKQAGA